MAERATTHSNILDLSPSPWYLFEALPLGVPILQSSFNLPSYSFQVKAALTRAYKKHEHKLPYALAVTTTGSKKKQKRGEGNEEREEGGLEDEEDPGNDEIPDEFM